MSHSSKNVLCGRLTNRLLFFSSVEIVPIYCGAGITSLCHSSRADAEEQLFVFEQNGIVRERGRFDNFSSLRSRNVRRHIAVIQTLQIETTKTIDVSKKFETVMIRMNLEKKKMLNKYFQSDGNQDETSQHLNLRVQKGGKPCTEHHTDE